MDDINAWREQAIVVRQVKYPNNRVEQDHRAIKRIKGRSSHDLREEFPWLKSRIPTLWTNSYFVSTVGGAPLAQVRKYIERQKEV